MIKLGSTTLLAILVIRNYDQSMPYIDEIIEQVEKFINNPSVKLTPSRLDNTGRVVINVDLSGK